MAVSIQVTFDCADPDRLATFWAAALGYQKQAPPEGFASWEDWLRAHHVPEDQWNSASAIVDPDGQGPRIFFQRVPEPKTVKDRLHLDLATDDLAAATQQVLDLGATRAPDVHEGSERWVVLRDPEGNEFCLIRPAS